MAVALRSSSVSGTADTNGTSCVVPVPTGAQIGDIALLAMEHWDTFDGTGITFPTGFTVVINGQLSGNREKLFVAWKRLTAADTGNYTITWTGSQWNMGHCLMVSGGLSSGDPVDTSNVSSTANTTTLPNMNIVPSVTNTFLAHFIANQSSSLGTPPTSFTEAQDGNYLKSNYQLRAASGLYTVSGGSTASSSFKSAAVLVILPSAGGGPISQAINTATETDAGQSLGRKKTKATAFPSESDSALTFARGKARSATLAAETDSAIGFARSKRKTLQAATETDVALPIGLVSGKAVNLAAETDTAFPFTKAKRKTVGTALETDTALVINSNVGISVPIGTALESDSTFAFGFARARIVGTAFEVDLAEAIGFRNPAWRLVMPQVVERFTLQGALSTSTVREATVFGDENGLFTAERGSPSPGTDEYGAIPFGTKYIWYGGHVNITDDPAVKNLWLSHGFEVENVQL